MKTDPDRFKCDVCSWIGHKSEILKAPNPFDPDKIEDIWGCPGCFSVDQLSRLCDEPGCNQRSTCGVPTPDGYRHTCGDHDPKRVKKMKRFLLDLSPLEKMPPFWQEGDPKMIPLTDGKFGRDFDVIEDELPAAVVTRWRSAALVAKIQRSKGSWGDKHDLDNASSMPMGFNQYAIPEGATITEVS